MVLALERDPLSNIQRAVTERVPQEAQTDVLALIVEELSEMALLLGRSPSTICHEL